MVPIFYIGVDDCSWTSDGQHFAVGLQSGVISIRNKVFRVYSFIAQHVGMYTMY